MEKLNNSLLFKDNFHLLAEIGVNHEGNIETAKKLFEQAKTAGCLSVKLQAYKADSLVTKFAKAYWDTSKEKIKSQIELFQKYDSFNIDDYVNLSNYAHSLGLQFGLSIFDPSWIALLIDHVDYFKVASADITFLPLLEEISKFNKPVILSTGASTLLEIGTAIETVTKYGNEDISLLHCILNYPTQLGDSNLNFLTKLRFLFPRYRIGLSDHVAEMQIERFVIARALGATIVEKHFTNDKELRGNDHYHSGNVEDFIKIIESVSRADELLGTGQEIMECEIPAREGARRSIVYATDLKIGQKITKDNLLFKRPGMGISPTEYPKILGRELMKDVCADMMVDASDFDTN